MPLAVPYEDSPPEARVLNAVVAGLVFEGRNDVAAELGLPKMDFARAIRSLKSDGAIYAGAGGRYRLSFHTSNFPNIVTK
jgi:DNA-binding IclR family transcriptional regulator